MNPFRPLTNLCEECQQKKPSPKVKTPMSKITSFLVTFAVLLTISMGLLIVDQFLYKKAFLIDPLFITMCLIQGAFIVASAAVTIDHIACKP